MGFLFGREARKIKRRWEGMKKRSGVLLILSVVAMFSFGCGQYAIKDSNLKCPKCGAVFTIDEGLKGIGP